MTQVCQALEYAHSEGVVHRDIKPENILVNAKGVVKIADFGLAKLLDPTPQDPLLTRAGQAMGTPHYMAPEQLERPLEVDHRADIYSLGVVFYELLTGELPLGRFQPPSDKVAVDVRVDEVVLKSLEREPERRYQRAAEVRTQVDTISTAPARPRKPKRRTAKTAWWVLGCLVPLLVVPVLFLVMGVFWFLLRADSMEQEVQEAALAAEREIRSIEIGFDPPETPVTYLRETFPSLLDAIGEECLNLDFAEREVRKAYEAYLKVEKAHTEFRYIEGEGVWSIEHAIVKPFPQQWIALRTQLEQHLETGWDADVISKADFGELFPYGTEELWISIEKQENGRTMLRVRQPEGRKNTWYYEEEGPRGWGRWVEPLAFER